MLFFLRRILLVLLAIVVFPFALAFALVLLLVDLILVCSGGTAVRKQNPEDRVLLIQSAEPAEVLNGLKHLRSLPFLRDSRITIFCRNRSEIVKHFSGNPQFSEVLTHSETKGWAGHFAQLRRERYDTVVIFFTGDPSYWKVKCFAFLLGGRRRLIFDENGHITSLSLRALFPLFERDLLFSGIFQSSSWKMHPSLRRAADRYRRFRSRTPAVAAPKPVAISGVSVEGKPVEPPPSAQAALPLPTDARHGLENAREMVTSLAQIALETFLSSSARLRLPSGPAPEVSVILVLYNRAELTLQCLRSLAEYGDVPLQIIIVDNASSDATSTLLDRIDGATILRNAENLHFLKGSNIGAQRACGRYILFLNNDAQVLPGTIRAAVRTLESAPDIGAVGGKLILPDGTLQEAGSIVWRDGSCLGYGRGGNPLSPEFMFRRDVDYCSGAFLLTRNESFKSMGGFDEAYQPFYYEETDFCIRLQECGLRVVYEPDAAVIHFEFASSPSSKEAQEWHGKHQGLFLERHQDRLKHHYGFGEENILRARSAGHMRPRVLFIDDRVPHPSLGSGFPRSNAILSGLVKLGCQVTFFPTDVLEEDWNEVYSDIPREVEVMLNYGPGKLDRFLAGRSGFYDMIFVSRPHNMEFVRPILQTHPDWFQNSRIIYDAEALFTFRDLALRKMKGISLSEAKIDQLIRSEIELVDVAELVISVSEAEGRTFARYGVREVRVLGHALAIEPSPRAFEDRNGILFVGSILEETSPNGDAILWFLKDIFPRIQSQLGNVPLIVAGMNRLDMGRLSACGQVRILGKIRDLTSIYDEARLFVAPTRFAAGLPHKIHEAAAHGVPVVATSLLEQQLGWRGERDLLVADDPPKFADQCIRLYRDAELWQRIRDGALERIRLECSPAAFENTLKSIIAGPLPR